MATEGAALSHLKDAYYILTHDLAGFDFVKHQSDIDSNPTSMDSAKQIAPVVSKLAPTMVNFNVAVESAHQLTEKGKNISFYMMTMVIIMGLVVVGIIMFVTYMRLKQLMTEHADVAVIVPVVGKTLLGVMAFVAFMLTWILLLRAHRLQLEHNADILKVGYWRIHNLVGGAYCMRFEAATQAGTLPDFVKNQDNVNGGSTLIPGPDCGADAEETDPVSCSRQIDPCGVNSPSLPQVISESCPHEISKMLGELEIIKAEGVDSYDRTALWKEITVGVDAIRRIVSVSADADTSLSSTGPVQPVQASEAQTLVTTQILPLLQTAVVKEQGLHILNIDPDVDPADIKQIHDDLVPLFDHMTSEILAIIQQLKYDLNIDDYRESIDASMSLFYGKAYPPIRFDLVSVLEKVQKAADARPPPAAMLYVDSATMLARVKDMGPSAWTDMVYSAEVTKEAVRTFLSKFKLPAAAPSAWMQITHMMTVILMLSGFVILILYITNVINLLYTTSLDNQVAARHIVIAACLYALATVTLHAMMQRVLLRSGHNWDAIKKNGQRLAYSLETTKEAALNIESATPLVAADAQKYIDAAVITVKAYEDCNSVTNGASVMPFPMMEVVIYCFIVVIVVASAVYGVDHLKPGEKVSSIRTLMRLRERVLDGDVPPGMTQQLLCCTPNESVWHILMWIAVCVLFCMNIYVMSGVQTTNDKYQQSLLLVDSCV